ncbi:hypothetical protein BGZ68_007600 [Mortierella alpina]|nr:hypothetical protein BGZ68_007600 [Mortierella alpina]
MQSSLSSPSTDIRLDSYYIDPTRGVGAGEQSQGSAQGFNSTTPPFPELSQQASTLYWHQQDNSTVPNDGRTLHRVSQSLTSSDSEQQHQRHRVHDGTVQLQRGKDSSTHMPQLPPQSGYSLFPRPENASTTTDNTPGGSWVSDLNAEEKGIARRQHDFHLRHSISATDVNPSTLRQADTQDSEDREVYRVCKGRLGVPTPDGTNDKKLTGTFQSPYLASRSGYKEGAMGSSRPHYTTLKEHTRDQGQSRQQDHEGYTLTDRQENNGLRRFTHPQFDVEHEEHPRDSFDRSREQEWLTIIARLKQQVADLNATNEELRYRLHDSEERFDRLIIEQDTKMLQLKEEHDHSVLDTKHRTKRLFDQVMRKQRLDEGKRLATVFKELQSVQLENTDLHTRIQTMQESTLKIERDSKDDARVLNTFWDRELLPNLRTGVPVHGQDTSTVREKSTSRKQRANSLWDTVHGLGQRQSRIGASKAAMGGTKSSAVAAKVATNDANADADADADADSDDGKGVKRGLGSHACKTPLGQQCLALLQNIITALIEPQESRGHGCSGHELHCRFARQEQEHFMDRRQQRKRYSDSSASSGKTIVALHSRQPSHADDQGGTVSSYGTVLRQDPVKYFGELRVEHQREIERIKTQCVLVYRESLEDIRAEMLAKMRSKSRVGCDKR